MITNYSRPQLTIKQFLARTQIATADRINAVILGAKYLLSRFGREETPMADFDGGASTQEIVYTYFLDGVETSVDPTYIVDQSRVDVWGHDLEAILAEFIGGTDPAGVVTFGNRLSLDAGDLRGSGRAAEFDGRDTRTGDLVFMDIGGAVFRRRVAGFITVSGVEYAVLDAAVPNGPVDDVTFAYLYTGPIANVTVDADKVTIPSNAALPASQLAGRSTAAEFAVDVGKVSVSFRAMIPASASDGYFSVRSDTDILEHAGKIDIENDFAYGLHKALTGAQGKRVFGVAVVSDDVAGYTAALRKLESTDLAYSLCALTNDLSVQQAVESHVDAMSTDERKNFRRAYLGIDSPGTYEALASQAFTADSFQGDAFRLVTLADGGLLAAGVRDGYMLTISGVDYAVAYVVSDFELVLAEDGPGASGVAEVWAPDTVDSQKLFVRSIARQFSNRRIACVWTEGGAAVSSGVFTNVPSRFVAAEIAGLRSALPPQAGLTRTEITTITSASAMYIRYTPDDLDDVAADGVFIVTQESENTPVYIRHQLTTKTDEGSLFYEDSVGVNVDDISFRIKDLYGPVIGRRNVTPTTLSEMRASGESMFNGLELGELDNEFGPQIISYRDFEVEAHPILKDRAQVGVSVEVPLPMNNIDVFLRATVGLTI